MTSRYGIETNPSVRKDILGAIDTMARGIFEQKRKNEWIRDFPFPPLEGITTWDMGDKVFWHKIWTFLEEHNSGGSEGAENLAWLLRGTNDEVNNYQVAAAK